MKLPVVILILARRERLAAAIGLFAAAFWIMGIFGEPPIPQERGPLAGKLIIVDPGHGGIDSGSSYRSLLEKDVVLVFSHELALSLQSHDGYAILTRSTDTDLSDRVSPEEEIDYSQEEYQEDRKQGLPTHPLDRGVALGTRYPPRYRRGLRARILEAREENADILISIHTNRFHLPQARGALTLYQEHSYESKLLAESIQDHLTPLLPGRTPDCGSDNFFILRRSDVPTVIVEIGFITNERDREMMLTESGRQAIIEAITQGVIDYFAKLSEQTG